MRSFSNDRYGVSANSRYRLNFAVALLESERQLSTICNYKNNCKAAELCNHRHLPQIAGRYTSLEVSRPLVSTAIPVLVPLQILAELTNDFRGSIDDLS